jgi:hypothetical protein
MLPSSGTVQALSCCLRAACPHSTSVFCSSAPFAGPAASCAAAREACSLGSVQLATPTVPCSCQCPVWCRQCACPSVVCGPVGHEECGVASAIPPGCISGEALRACTGMQHHVATKSLRMRCPLAALAAYSIGRGSFCRSAARLAKDTCAAGCCSATCPSGRPLGGMAAPNRLAG